VSPERHCLERWRDAAIADVRLHLRWGGPLPTHEERLHDYGTHPDLRERTPDALEAASYEAYCEAYDESVAAAQ
jgi:hypothetical protein